jgi:ABC-type dipeptide/oligopeptide/nickel transport system permease component
VIWGARASLLAGVVSVLISLSIGVPIGLLAGYAGGKIDTLISRLTDAVLACPFLILAIALAAFLGPSLTNAMIAIGVSARRSSCGSPAARRSRSRPRSSCSPRARSATLPGASRLRTCCRTSFRRSSFRGRSQLRLR